MSPDISHEHRRFQEEPVDLRLEVSPMIASQVGYALACYPNYSSFARLGSLKEFCASLLKKGLEIVNEELQRGEESPSPLRIPPYPEEMPPGPDPKEISSGLKTLECAVDQQTVDTILDYLNRAGERWHSNQPLPQHISEKLLIKGLDYLGFEAWEEADKHNR